VACINRLFSNVPAINNAVYAECGMLTSCLVAIAVFVSAAIATGTSTTRYTTTTTLSTTTASTPSTTDNGM